MFGWFKTKKPTNKSAKAKCDWKSSKAHLLMLSKFIQPQAPERFQNDPNWKEVLGESPRDALRMMRSDGMLRPCEIQELLEAKFKVSEMKQMLKAAGLKVSGRKAEQAERLIENDLAGARQAVGDFFALRCTNEGEDLSVSFLAEQEKERESAEAAAFAKLKEHKFKEAASIVTNFEKDQVFSRGIGIDWSDAYPARQAHQLEMIFKNIPKILSGIDEHTFHDLRIAAGMMELWGTNSAKAWFPKGIETESHLESDAAARMLLFHARHMDDLQGYKKEGFKKIQVMGVDDNNQCEACQALDGKSFPIKKVPELPLANCTCEIGCRCLYSVDLD